MGIICRIALLWAFAGSMLLGCARSPLKDSGKLFRPTQMPQVFLDNLEMAPLIEGLETQVKVLSLGSGPIQFGSYQVDRAAYVDGLKGLIQAYQKSGLSGFHEAVQQNFMAMEPYGQRDWGDVFITSYYDGLFQARSKPRGDLFQPIYGRPKDLVQVELDEFRRLKSKASDEEDRHFNWMNEFNYQKLGRKFIGRLAPSVGEGLPRVIPYFDRQAIDSEQVLKGRKLELAYMDPMDAFFMQIQGSAILEFPGGKRKRFGYDSQNGHSYHAIGRELLDVIPIEKMSLQSIKAHLKTLPPEKMQEVLNTNPSYVFFRELKGRSLTSNGTETIPGRTIATDRRLFAKGTLAYMIFERPYFDSESSLEPESTGVTSRFVIDQDTGGAIRGPGRVDLYWGEGADAERHAGHMKSRGRLIYLIPKGALPEAK